MAKEPTRQRLFDDLPLRDRSPLRAHWWILALAFHAALLGIPVAWHGTTGPSPEAEPVTVTFVAPPRVADDPEPVEPAEPVPPEEPPERVPDPPVEIARQRPPEPPAPNPPPILTDTPPPGEAEEPEPVPLEMRKLLETVAAMDWSEPEREARAIGRSTESEVTEWLRQPVLALEGNTFDGMTAPSEVEITDRWMSPGGEQNVVIRAPDGNTYCGRQGPVDDLRPWLQMPMLFHRCAGGGKRGGAASWRNN
jgi:hypothetical protein